MNWLKRWLGIDDLSNKIAKIDSKLNSEIDRIEKRTEDLVAIDTDLVFRGDSRIIISTKLNGGQVRIIEAHFVSIGEFMKLYEELVHRYNTSKTVTDVPMGIRRFFGR